MRSYLAANPRDKHGTHSYSLSEFGLDREQFLADWSSDAAKQETWRDYATSQRAGVTGFPTLIGGPNEHGVYGVVARGYAPGEQVLAVLKDWISRIAA